MSFCVRCLKYSFIANNKATKHLLRGFFYMVFQGRILAISTAIPPFLRDCSAANAI